MNLRPLFLACTCMVLCMSLCAKSYQDDTTYSSRVTNATKVNEDLRSSNKPAFPWKTGEEIRVKRDDSNMLLTPDNEIASLNAGYLMSNNGSIRGRITIANDTMIVDYYEGDNLMKREAYRGTNDGRILLDGNQYYFVNGRVISIDLIRKGTLLGSTWLDADGNKDRSFIYSPTGVAAQTLYYPTGEKMCIIDYVHDTVTCFDQSGNVATFEPCSLSEDFERFTKFFNQAFRYNRMYTRESFLACVTVGADGRCSAWAYHDKDHHILPVNCAQAPQWQPAKINGQPVASTVFRVVEYDPMEYAACGDTLPMRITQSAYATYNGRNWINTCTYAATCADTCSKQGTVCKSGDTTVLTCFNRLTGEPVVVQRYTKDSTGKYIKQGWSTYYANGKKSYEDFAVNDTVLQTVHYSEQEVPLMVFAKKPGKAFIWDTMWTYYPTGEVKTLTLHRSKDDDLTTYFDKQGQPTKDVVLPTYPGGAKAMNKYLKKTVSLQNSKLAERKNWNSLDCTADIFVEIDETGQVIHAGKGASSCSQNYNLFPLGRGEVDELFELIVDCVRQNPTPWTPGTINGEPITLITKISVKYACTNKK